MRAAVLAALVACSTATAYAQDIPPDRMEEGRALYEAGLVAARAERWADAQRNFQRAHALTRSSAALFNLALAHRALGQPLSAVEALDELIGGHRIDAQLRARAHRLRVTALEEIAEIVLIGLAPDRRYEIALDSRLVPDRGERPLSIAADPGARAVVVRDGTARWRWTGELADGERATLEPFTAGESSLLASPWLWGGVAAVLVGAAVAGFLIASRDDDIEPRGRYVPL